VPVIYVARKEHEVELHEHFKIAPVLWQKIRIWGRVSKEVFAEQRQ